MDNLLSVEFGLTEKNGIPLASSRKIAEKFSKRHDHILRDIESALDTFNQINNPKFGEINFQKSCYKDDKNRKQPEYLMTRDGFTYIAMGFSGSKAAKFKIDYINAFNQMESFIKNLLEAKADFPEFTDAIMAAHAEPKHYHFSNELDMINRIVLGMSAKQFREQHGIQSGKSIRLHLTAEQIQAVKTLQRMDIGIILTTPEFQDRKRILEQQYMRLSRRALTA